MRQEFTDKQKAQIYVRDRAVCAFSGKVLWIADYGICPTYDIDWVDHIKPASRGGGNTIDNGVCASYFYNSKKSSNSRDNKYLFFAGRPTEHFFYFNEVVPSDTADHLKRFANSATSDWYFNRALFRFMLGLSWIRAKKLGKIYVRDDRYYAKAAVNALKQWRRLAKDQGTFKQRGLLQNPLSEDQSLLILLENAQTESDVLEHMQNCFSIYDQSCDAMNALCSAKSADARRDLNIQVSENSSIAGRVRTIILTNCQILEGF